MQVTACTSFSIATSTKGVCTVQRDAASEACACGMNPGSGAKAFSTIRPVAVGN